ncbi:hypothetical protein KIW84_062220 [Lathyrus oleraceus]|uniref:YTH domain-containing family protein n=1 Tax=Pisum sativum TaxID=3888 RepID=A0A9D4W4I0_PEA|nr:hypothetical protein KIW84_062220 [Pisum sativum]
MESCFKYSMEFLEAGLLISSVMLSLCELVHRCIGSIIPRSYGLKICRAFNKAKLLVEDDHEARHTPAGTDSGPEYLVQRKRENTDGLNELNRGPRAKGGKNQKFFFAPTVLAVKGQNLPTVVDEEKEKTSNILDREQYNKADFPEEYTREMIGPVDFNKSLEYWQQDKWNGCFPLKWHIVKDVPNNVLRHIILLNNENKPVTNSRDTQEVLLDVIAAGPRETNSYDDEGEMERRGLMSLSASTVEPLQNGLLQFGFRSSCWSSLLLRLFEYVVLNRVDSLRHGCVAVSLDAWFVFGLHFPLELAYVFATFVAC